MGWELLIGVFNPDVMRNAHILGLIAGPLTNLLFIGSITLEFAGCRDESRAPAFWTIAIVAEIHGLLLAIMIALPMMMFRNDLKIAVLFWISAFAVLGLTAFATSVKSSDA